MSLAEGQLQLRGLVMGPGTSYRLAAEVNPWSRTVRADQGDKRAWGHGSWSGAEWTDQTVVPIRLITLASNTAGWIALHQQLMAAFAPSHDDLEFRFARGGVEYVMYGRPRVVEPEVTYIGQGVSVAQCAFVALDPFIYSGVEHSTQVGLPSIAGGLTLPVTDGASAGGSNPGFELGTNSSWTPGAGTIAASQDFVKVGLWAGKLTADGTNNPRATHAQAATIVTPGEQYRYSGWLYAPVALPSTASITIQWYTAAGGFVSQDVLTNTLTPGVWTFFEGVFTAPSTATRAARQFSMNGTPTVGTLLYGDEFLVLPLVGGLTLPATVNATVIAGRKSIVNAGTATARLLLRIDGPVPEPRVSLLVGSVASTLRFDLALTSGQWLDVDTASRTVYINGTASRRGQASGDWPVLPTGTSEIAFDAATYDPGAMLTIRWRDAW